MNPVTDAHLWTTAESQIRIPGTGEKVFKDECSFCIESAEHPDGVYICMKYFIAIGPTLIRKYAAVTKSNVFLHHRIIRQLKERLTSELRQQPTKLAIGVPGGFESPQDRWEVTEKWSLVLFPGDHRLDLPALSETDSSVLLPCLQSLGLPERLASAVSAVMLAESAILAEERARNVAAWEAENLRPVSAYASTLQQLHNGVKIAPTGWKCSECDLRENLWLNLTDGSINCGRRFWDGSGGNNHAVEHYSRTHYPLAVKLGTITPEGAEVFSYAEDDMVTDPLLAEHLAHFGIDIMRMQKTDKTVAELEISANERLGEWRLLQESDRELEPRYGPGMTGLRNLGNTCYMNSVLQVLFAIPIFRRAYAYQLPKWIDIGLSALTASNGDALPVDDVGLQFARLGYGLCSGAYSWPCPENPDEAQALVPGIRPLLFRRLMAQRSKTFASHHQQDACEFFSFLLDLLDSTSKTSLPPTPEAVSSCLRLSVEDRLECGLTNKVRYTMRNEYVLTLPVPMDAMLNKCEFDEYEKRQNENKGTDSSDVVRARIPFESCLSAWCSTERVEDFITPASNPPGTKTFALRQSRLLNFPDYLCVQLAKYTVGSDWLPRKLDCDIVFQSSSDGSHFVIDLSCLRSPGGMRPDEQPMPEGDPASDPQPPSFTADPAIMSELMNMGFTEVACTKACKATNNNGLEAAAGWIMEHLDDPTLNDPPAESNVRAAYPKPNEDALAMLTAMGLTLAQATKALRQTNNDLEAAANWAFTNPDALNIPDDTEAPTVTGHNASCNASERAAEAETTLTDGSPVYNLIGFISHMGKSTSHGHYVAHIRRSELADGISGKPVPPPVTGPVPPCGGSPDEWIIFNDEKVAKSESPPYGLAYLYVFRRADLPRAD